MKNVIWRTAILGSVTEEGLSNKVTLQKRPEVRAVYYMWTVYVGEMHSERERYVQRARGGNMIRMFEKQMEQSNAIDCVN